MPWLTLKDYCLESGLSDSTVRRRIKKRQVPNKVENGRYFLFQPDNGNPAAPRQTPGYAAAVADSSVKEEAPGPTERMMIEGGGPQAGRLESVVSFSSKALNSYLMVSDRLTREKDIRLKEKEDRIAELELRIDQLENDLSRMQQQYISNLKGER